MEALLTLNICWVIFAMLAVGVKEMIINYQKKSTRNQRSEERD